MSQRKRRKPLSESVKNALKKKADGTRFFYGELAEVYRKGQGAYLSGGSRNVTMQAWSFGRVNSYMRGDKARTADAAIYNKYQKRPRNTQVVCDRWCDTRPFNRHTLSHGAHGLCALPQEMVFRFYGVKHFQLHSSLL